MYCTSSRRNSMLRGQENRRASARKSRVALQKWAIFAGHLQEEWNKQVYAPRENYVTGFTCYSRESAIIASRLSRLAQISIRENIAHGSCPANYELLRESPPWCLAPRLVFPLIFTDVSTTRTVNRKEESAVCTMHFTVSRNFVIYAQKHMT